MMWQAPQGYETEIFKFSSSALATFHLCRLRRSSVSYALITFPRRLRTTEPRRGPWLMKRKLTNSVSLKARGIEESAAIVCFPQDRVTPRESAWPQGRAPQHQDRRQDGVRRSEFNGRAGRRVVRASKSTIAAAGRCEASQCVRRA